MEESISSSRTSTAFYCNNDGYYEHGITAAASEDSGWTAYFDDFLQGASREEPAPARKKLHHGVCATASTLSSSANRKKAVKEKMRPRSSELEDPLQDTASSPANATQLQVYMYSAMHAPGSGYYHLLPATILQYYIDIFGERMYAVCVHSLVS